MHEMLAFAAFCRASKEQHELRQDYYTLGIHHQDCAIRGLRKNIANMAPQETVPIIATSTLLPLSVFASSGFEAECSPTNTPPCAIDGLLNCFYLAQGMGRVLELAQAAVANSFLAPIYRDPSEVTPSQPLLVELLQQIPSLSDHIRNRNDLLENERAAYLAATENFGPSLNISIPPKVDNRELRFLFFWPLLLSAEFIALLQQRRPGALSILMYYATALLAAEPRYWFMDGWGQRVLKACYEAIDQSWLPAIQWPLSFLNSGATFDLFTNLVRRQDSAASPRGLSYPQRPAAEIAHRHTNPGQLASTDATDTSSPPREFSLKIGDGSQKPFIQLASSTSGPPPAVDDKD
jgi:hypothetical protein